MTDEAAAVPVVGCNRHQRFAFRLRGGRHWRFGRRHDIARAARVATSTTADPVVVEVAIAMSDACALAALAWLDEGVPAQVVPLRVGQLPRSRPWPGTPEWEETAAINAMASVLVFAARVTDPAALVVLARAAAEVAESCRSRAAQSPRAGRRLKMDTGSRARDAGGLDAPKMTARTGTG